jgi:hemerythrin-like domain-containing protein
MSGLNTLRRDHSMIGTMLGVLEASVGRLRQGRYVDPQMQSGMVRFFEQFVGTCHHTQEETALFPLLTSSEQGAAIVPALVRQHACQRDSLGLVADAFSRARRREGRALDALAFYVRAYTASVQAHLFLEDRFFADATVLTAGQEEELSREFTRIERAVIGATGREWYNQLVADYKDITFTWEHWPDLGGPESPSTAGHGQA